MNSSSSTSGRECPWQLEWKRPQWQSLSAESKTSHDDSNEQSIETQEQVSHPDDYSDWNVLSSTSAQVLRDEIPDSILLSSTTNMEAAGISALTMEESIYWVTVTVISSPPSSSSSLSKNHPHVIQVLVELFQQPNRRETNQVSAASDDKDPSLPSSSSSSSSSSASSHDPPIQRLFTRTLQWPESALLPFDDDNDNDELQQPKSQPQDDGDDPHQRDDDASEEPSAKPLKQNKHHNNFWMFFTGDALFHRRPNDKPSHDGVTAATTCVGLTSVALCRLPPPPATVASTNTTTSSTSDALDAISFLSFGLVPTITIAPAALNPSARSSNDAAGTSTFESLESAVDDTPTDDVEATTTTQIKDPATPPQPTNLILACLTPCGKIHVYSLWKLLTFENSAVPSPTTDSDSDDTDDAFAQGWLELWLGASMHQRLQQSIRPLSRPMVTVSLSTVSFLQRDNRPIGDVSKNDTADADKEHVGTGEIGVDDGKDEVDDMEGNLPPLWDETVWDSSVDPSTAMYRTFDNVPTMMVPAFQYLAIAGKGLRKIRHRRQAHKQRRHPQHDSAASKSHRRDGGGSNAINIQQVQWLEQERVVEHDASVASETSQTSSASAPTAGPSSPNHRQQHRQRQQVAVGGFVTLISLYNYSEMRTVFLPFVPERLSPIVWGDMTFLLVIPVKSLHHQYPYHPVAIRINSQPNEGLISCGKIPFLVSINNNNSFSEEARSQQQRRRSSNEPEQQLCTIPRFKLLPVLLPREESSSALVLVGSSPYTFPPALAVVQERKVTNLFGGVDVGDEEMLVTLHTFENIDIIPKQLVDSYLRTSQDSVIPAIVTQHPSSHVARIPFTTKSNGVGRWCCLGQGWCIVGRQGIVYFVSWEGATSSRGAYVKQVGTYEESAVRPPPSFILPSLPNSFHQHSSTASNRLSASSRLSDRQAKSLLATAIKECDVIDDEALGDHETEEILVEALENISGLTYREPGASPNSSLSASRRRSSFNHRERSAVLLRHCSSWTQLDDATHNRSNVANQVPIVWVRSSATSLDCFVLSLRRIVVECGDAAPFNDVLSWMSQQEDFFTAASVALALLRDAETLRQLWTATEHVEADEEMSRLEGLLDGIIPLDHDLNNVLNNERQLADMTVGCLVKGGFTMSSTLELFVSHDIHYDPSRACLMLVAATACAVSGDEETMKSAMGRNYKADDNHEKNIMWPVRCLLQLGVSRGYLAKALILLNATIPDELRRRRPIGTVVTMAPSMTLCTSLVSLVVGAAPGAAELLLGLVDQQSRSRFWQSLNHETKLALALVSISGKSPMLRQAEVRAWARLQLNECIKDEISASGVNVYEVMPTEWLRQLCMACFLNAGCDITYLYEPSLPDGLVDEANDIEHHACRIRLTRNALIAARGTGGLDFDLVIPALLLLSHRGSQVQDEFQVSTQAVLEAACYLAGRPESEEAIFGFDGATVMRLCATSGNVSAGANLIGGRDGLVLKCCDILICEAGMTMDDAESFLVNDDVNLQTVNSLIQFENLKFVLNDGHHFLLRILDEYVLKVRTYGDFQIEHARGKVDPIFAARCFFRTWLCLTMPDTSTGSTWLVAWLRHRLGMKDDAISGRRLACSAILRALVWPATNKAGMVDLNSPQHLLATALDVESKFLVQLAQACCGLVESLPPWVAEEVLRSFDSSGQASFGQLTLEV